MAVSEPQPNAGNASVVHAPAPASGRCRFRRADETSAVSVQHMTRFGVTMEPDIEYYLVFPPQEAVTSAPDGERRPVRPIGYVALNPQPGSTMVIDGFYLVPEERGRGYARSMMLLVAQRTHKNGCRHVTTAVNRNNYQAMLVCESLGFVPVGERDGNVVYDLEL